MSNKIALVTGASRGIGRAIAEKFLSQGYTVYGTYFKSLQPMEEIAAKYGADKFKIMGPYDFRNLSKTDKLIKDLLGVELDVLVCSAGIFIENDDFANFDLNIFNQTMNCNFYTPLLLGVKLQSNLTNNGSIIIVSSNDAFHGAYGSMSYTISKAALLSLNKCLCVNYGRRGIRVNSVSPGAINTDMNTPEQEKDAPEFTPIERIGAPQEVAETIYFLASENSGFVNGENIMIDGGYGNVSVLLKKENSRIREFKGYDYIFEYYQTMKSGDTLIHISPCADYTWIDNQEEKELLNQNIEAGKRGVIIHRILIVDEEREAEIKNNQIIKQYFSNLQSGDKMYVVKKADVIKCCPDDYQKVGLGFGVLNNKLAFVDSYSSANSIGYAVEGEKLIAPLVTAFSNILKNIESGNIKPLVVEI